MAMTVLRAHGEPRSLVEKRLHRFVRVLVGVGHEPSRRVRTRAAGSRAGAGLRDASSEGSGVARIARKLTASGVSMTKRPTGPPCGRKGRGLTSAAWAGAERSRRASALWPQSSRGRSCRDGFADDGVVAQGRQARGGRRPGAGVSWVARPGVVVLWMTGTTSMGGRSSKRTPARHAPGSCEAQGLRLGPDRVVRLFHHGSQKHVASPDRSREFVSGDALPAANGMKTARTRGTDSARRFWRHLGISPKRFGMGPRVVEGAAVEMVRDGPAVVAVAQAGQKDGARGSRWTETESVGHAAP
jgi:hypothetical protein